MARGHVVYLGTLVVLASVLVSTLGWLQDTKNCFCSAVNNHDYSQTLHSFGSVQHCKVFLSCPCSHSAMITCVSACDHKVKEWVCDHNCGGGRDGTKVRAAFKASVCRSGHAHDVYVCGQQNNCARGK